MAILENYSEMVVRLVTDPWRGLPGKLKWLPSTAEVREACEAEMAPIRREEARQRQYAATRALLAPVASSAEEQERIAAGLAELAKELRGEQMAKKATLDLENILAQGGALAEPFSISPALAEKLAQYRADQPSPEELQQAKERWG